MQNVLLEHSVYPACALRFFADQMTDACPICLQPLLPEESKEWLTCGHCMHYECIQNYADVKTMPIEELPCPLCKISAVKIDDADPSK